MPSVRGTVVGAGGSGTAVSALTIDASAQPGDIAYYVISQGGGQTITPSFSSGNTWTTGAALQAWNGTTNRTTVYKRVLDATDPGTTCSAAFGVAQVWAAALIIVQDGDEPNVVISTPTVKTTASTTDTFNSVSPFAANSLIVYIDGDQQSSSSATPVTHTQPTNYTELIDQSQTGTNNHVGIAIGTRSLAGTSPETVGSITLNLAARQGALVIAVPPAPATVALTPAVLQLAAQPVQAAPTATLTPAVLQLAGQPVVPAPQVALSPAVLALAAQPVAPAPAVALTAAVLQLAGVPVAPAPRVALTPAVVALSAPPTVPAPAVALAPAVLNLAGQPLQITGSAVVTLTSAVLQLTGRPLSSAPAVALQPALISLTGRPLVPAPAVALQPAVLTLAGQALAVTPTVQLAPATVALVAVPLAPLGASIVTLTPAVLVFVGRPLRLPRLIVRRPGGVPVLRPAGATVNRRRDDSVYRP
jgi:hypothetical protein